jgi:hypothetical protein
MGISVAGREFYNSLDAGIYACFKVFLEDAGVSAADSASSSSLSS